MHFVTISNVQLKYSTSEASSATILRWQGRTLMIGYTVHHLMDLMDRVQKKRVLKVVAMPVTKGKHSDLFGCSVAPNNGEKENMQNF